MSEPEYSVAQNPYRIAIVDRILDNIHGQIGLTQVEKEIEKLPIFKRLHNISQLGLVNRIFPCAVHNRYSHSLGVMHVAALMAESINGKCYTPFFSDDEIQVIRLAGLLHDIGHYPMSHNVEAVYKEPLKPNAPVREQLKVYVNCPKDLDPEKDRREEKDDFLKSFSGSTGMHHECIGQFIIVNNEDIAKCVKDNYILLCDQESKEKKLNPYYDYKGKKGQNNPKYTKEEIDEIVKNVMTDIGHIVIGNYSFKDAEVIGGNRFPFEKYSAMVQLIHSELDADNIDYLLRDATFSGTSYGIMDMSQLIGALTVTEMPYQFEDSEGIQYLGKKYLVGVVQKRVGCVEQFLVSKYMAYGQVIFSKYVSILEAMLFRVTNKLITAPENDDTDEEDYTKKKLSDMISKSKTERKFLCFNDSYILNKIRSYVKPAYPPPSPDREMFEQINKNLAFDILDEVSSVSLRRETLIHNIEETDLYKEFETVCAGLESKTEEEILNIDRSQEGLISKLLSYRFESYKLTKQLPYEEFLQTYKVDEANPLIKFQYHYFRMAEGIPVIEKDKHYSYIVLNGEINNNLLPKLVVDLPSSLLHEIFSLRFVYLRKYNLRIDQPAS